MQGTVRLRVGRGQEPPRIRCLQRDEPFTSPSTSYLLEYIVMMMIVAALQPARPQVSYLSCEIVPRRTSDGITGEVWCGGAVRRSLRKAIR